MSLPSPLECIFFSLVKCLFFRAQQLENFIQHGEVENAIMKALDLGMPEKLYRCFEKLDADKKAFESIISRMEVANVQKCLRCAMDWNTNSRYCHIAQGVISACFSSFTPESIIGDGSVVGSKALKAMNAYSERHYRRLERLHTKSYLFDFYISNLLSLSPEIKEEEEEKEEGQEQQQQEEGKKKKKKPSSVKEVAQVGKKSASDPQAQESLAAKENLRSRIMRRSEALSEEGEREKIEFAHDAASAAVDQYPKKRKKTQRQQQKKQASAEELDGNVEDFEPIFAGRDEKGGEMESNSNKIVISDSNKKIRANNE